MIRFSKYIVLYMMLSSIVILPGMYSLFRWGVRQSIDFTGGTVLEVKVAKHLTTETVWDLGKKYNVGLVNVTENKQNEYTIRYTATDASTITSFEQSIGIEAGTMEVLKKDMVGPIIGKELLSKAIVASLFVVCAILSYVAYAFKSFTYGIAAVASLAHDMLIMFCSFSLLGHFFGVEVDTLFVTAFLTTMSFSVHDTIVIFDRIREYRRKDTRTQLTHLSDMALTETIGRSLVNSFTIIFMLLSLVLMGGETVRWFAMALLIGTITGTYSSPFIAVPVLLFLDTWKQKK